MLNVKQHPAPSLPCTVLSSSNELPGRAAPTKKYTNNKQTKYNTNNMRYKPGFQNLCSNAILLLKLGEEGVSRHVNCQN